MTTVDRLCSDSSENGWTVSRARRNLMSARRCHTKCMSQVRRRVVSADSACRIVELRSALCSNGSGRQRIVSEPSREMHAHVTLFETERTCVRLMIATDAAFIRELLNEPSFMRYIGDRQVRTRDEADTFIETRYRQSYRDHGYGLYIVESRATGEPMGICGFVRREALSDVDMGFAFLSRFEGQGLAFEAANATLHYGRATLGLTRVLAIAQMDNARSHSLLARLGFQFDSLLTMPDETTQLSLFVSHV